jgi:hypothetical protein
MHDSGEEFSNISLARLADGCERESQRFFRGESYDPGFCYELFRRAILQADERAWHLVYDLYTALVTSWVVKHPAFHASGEQSGYFVNRAFDRMWSAITAEKFSQYRDLKALLRYLQMCVHSAIIDHARKSTQTELELEASEYFQGGSPKSDLEERVLAAVQRGQLWQEIEKRLNSEEEGVVLYASFALGLKARQILETYPEIFESIERVYLTKQNVMARLRRDEELKALFAG